MTVEIWLGEEFRHAHEMRALSSFVETMRDNFADNPELYMVLAGYYCSGREIDLTILKRNAIIVVELKDCSAPVVGGMRGEWQIHKDGEVSTLNAGRANPFVQVRTQRYTLLNFLRDNEHAFLSQRKIDRLRLDHVAAWVVFSPRLHPNSKIQIDESLRWFRALGLDELPRQVYIERSNYLDFDHDELVIVARDLLGCHRVLDPIWLPRGRPEVVAAPTPTTMSPAPLEQGEVPKPTPCFICSIGNTTCRVKQLAGAVTEVRQIRTEAGVSVSVQLLPEDCVPTWLYLNPPWDGLAPTLSYLLAERKARLKAEQPHLAAYHLEERVHQGNISFATGSESLVVLEPDLLINANSLAEYAECPMRYLLDRVRAEPPNPATVRGSVIHEAFREFVRESGIAEAAVRSAVDSKVMEMASAGTSESDMIREVLPHVRRLSIIKGDPCRQGTARFETLVLSPQLGLTGRIDAIWETNDGRSIKNITELKTGKAKWNGEAIWPRDELQAAAYAAMLWSSGHHSIDRDQVRVLYSGGEVAHDLPVQLNFATLKRVVQLRNEATKFDLTEHPPSGVFPCNQKCPDFCRTPCRTLSRLLGFEPFEEDLELLPEDKTFFETYFALLRHERWAAQLKDATLHRKTVAERVEDGNCIQLEDVKEQYERTEDCWRYEARCNNRSEIRPGDWVIVSDGNPVGARIARAEIEKIKEDSVEFVASERLAAPLAVDLYESAGMLDRSFNALYLWLRAERRLREAVYGVRLPEFAASARVPVDGLNESQRCAVNKALRTRDYSLIWGPPGTGKTKVIAHIARTMASQGQRVLLSAYTNQAIDNLCQKLLQEGVENFVILGERRRSSVELDKNRLTSIVAARTGEDAPVETKRQETRQVLREASIVVSTAYGLAGGSYDNLLARFPGKPPFDLVVVDEASQMTVPSTVSAIRLGSAFVLVGDHWQLPPVVLSEPLGTRSSQAEGARLSKSLFEILWQRHGGSDDDAEGDNMARAGVESPCSMLLTQYRMNWRIAEFSNCEWYGRRLVASDNVRELTLRFSRNARAARIVQQAMDPLVPAVLVHIDHRLARTDPVIQRVHPVEAEFVHRLVNYALARGVDPKQIGVIAPYRAQVAEIRRRLAFLTNVYPSARDTLLVDTVDRFQGSERELIIVSFTTYEHHLGPLLEDLRRLNVAMTRAKHKLVMVGDMNVLAQEDTYARLLSHYRTELYRGGQGVLTLRSTDAEEMQIASW